MIWFLFGVIIATFLLNWITLKYGFQRLDYSMDISKKTAEIGEDISITSTLENKKLLSITFLQVEEKFPKGLGAENHQYSIYILPYQRVKRTYSVNAEERGLYLIKNTALGLGDFIGFKTIYENKVIDKSIVILPRKLDIKDALVPIGSLNGSISVRRWIIDDPLMTIGIREYTGNEPERHIHWPSSLKYGNLMVKNFDFTTDNSVIILLNIESIKPFWVGIDKGKIEYSISLVRGIMEELEENKIPYGFATNAYGSNSIANQFYYPGLGKNQLNYLLEMLGRISYGISSNFEDFLKDISKTNYTTFVVVTPKIFPEYIEPLNNLAKLSTRVILITLDTNNMDKISKNIVRYGTKL